MSDTIRRKIDENAVDTILADDIDFSGTLTFKEPLMIKGKFCGEIKASGDLYVGEDAEVKAKIDANIISTKGKITGDINAIKRVELFATAKIDGDITSPDLVMESGAVFNGYCNMSGEPREKKEK